MSRPARKPRGGRAPRCKDDLRFYLVVLAAALAVLHAADLGVGVLFDGQAVRAVLLSSAAVQRSIFVVALATGLLLTSERLRGRRARRAPKGVRRVGAWEVGERLGEGGMGEVYEARHCTLPRTAALKVIKEAHLDAAGLSRFQREAEILSELSHPNTVTLYDQGRAEDGTWYYAMERVEGMDLEALMRREGTLPAGRVLYLLRQIAASLAEAHRKGILHRDIKPSNVMVCCREGAPDFVKVLDFGLARRFGTEGVRGERTSLIAGTPQLMAPEAVYDSGALGPATDIYGVGALGYFLLTGSFPFDGDSWAKIASAHLLSPPLPPSLRTANEVPRALEDVLMRCLAKLPGERPADGQALLEALEALEGCAEIARWSETEARQWWRELAARGEARRAVAPREEAAGGEETVVASGRGGLMTTLDGPVVAGLVSPSVLATSPTWPAEKVREVEVVGDAEACRGAGGVAVGEEDGVVSLAFRLTRRKMPRRLAVG
ncbi:serine/threonine-protein kinase [Chondromyces crocatus]|uniref:Protein kinase domain-containing protein n=1 Tax=Chondromyces crocatus TaxID=52 RepID=A0A0K1ETY6_CHOCO|nr:serine/threonine-protein kinase [Chondromyces crocatus]AKT44102.1 uncharacterized protein CMC5_083420 [Chondromyces crocatus]